MAAEPVKVVRLDGLHALKHALRFGAPILDACSDDVERVIAAAAAIAPDIVEWLGVNLRAVSTSELRNRTDQPHASRVVAFAARPSALVPRQASTPIVLLEEPRHLANVGAVVRVAAAAGAAGVLTVGQADPWHPTAVRTSAGLHFAVPIHGVASLTDALTVTAGPFIGIDPDGDDLRGAHLPAGAVLCFGTEREGLSGPLAAACDALVRIPMRPQVSSLNLATSVAVVLYQLALPDSTRSDLA